MTSAGCAAKSSAAIHAGRPLGLDQTTTWSAGPCASTQRECGSRAGFAQGHPRAAFGRPGVKSTICFWCMRNSPCRPRTTRIARWAYEQNPRSPITTSPGSRSSERPAQRAISCDRSAPLAELEWSMPVATSNRAAHLATGNPQPGRWPVEIGEQMGRTSACDRDPPGDRWHRRGSRCGKSYSDFLGFFVFIDSRNR